MSEVSANQQVKLVGFGTFDHLLRRTRKRRNPKTGETVVVPTLKAPRFRPSEEFKRKLNK
jgi:nucleoid DNA-binding protein